METTNKKRHKKQPQELLDGLLKELIYLYNGMEGFLDCETVLLTRSLDFLRDLADFREHVPWDDGLRDKLEHWFDEADDHHRRTSGKWVPKQRVTDWS